MNKTAESLENSAIELERRDTHSSRLWRFHPAADYFLSRGGDRTAPPVYCNLALTNKCNLRCEICGSQKYLDETGLPRRHMDLAKFQAVAETLFPFTVEVELNSQGDPLLHPEIDRILETIAAYRCDVKIQTNGTLFTDRVIEIMMRQHGTIMLSLDAVGPRFDEVRRGGEWAKSEPQLVKFLRRRDPNKLYVGVYPTMTRRTIGEVINIAQWSFVQGIDHVAFHRYNPIQNSFEEEPSREELEQARRRLEDWIGRHGDVMKITFDGIELNTCYVPSLRDEFADPGKRSAAQGRLAEVYPMESDRPGADLEMICVAPTHYVEIGLDGQIGVCCRAQDVVLGCATSVSEFADAWLGGNYAKIRKSLRRDATIPYPLPNCESCIKFLAPRVTPQRQALKYDRSDINDPDALTVFGTRTFKLEVIERHIGFCHVAELPLPIRVDEFELWENERPLGPGNSMVEDIRQEGKGRYLIWGRGLYFSTSDNTDARRNGRSYTLRSADLLMPTRRSDITDHVQIS